MHMRSKGCSRVDRYCSLGKHWEQLSPLCRGMMDT